jgi:hypothetical protein
MYNIRYRGEFTKSNNIPSTILGMMWLHKQAAVNLVLARSAVITGKPSGTKILK